MNLDPETLAMRVQILEEDVRLTIAERFSYTPRFWHQVMLLGRDEVREALEQARVVDQRGPLTRLESLVRVIEDELDDLRSVPSSWQDPTPEQMRREWERMRKWVAPLIVERDHFECRRCGALVHLTVDHVRPISQGGRNSLANLQTLCRSCNARKGDRVDE